MENNETIGAKIVALRKARGYTQADLGAYLNISYQAVSKWERDESCPDFETLSKIAQLFSVPISYFERGNAEMAISSGVQAVEAENEPIAKKEMLGVCKDCGKVVFEDTVAMKYPTLVCKECDARRKRIAEAKAAEQKRAEQKRREDAQRKAQAVLAEGRALRNKGLIWGGVISGGLALAGIGAGAGAVGVGLFLFFFVSQLFWDGAVVSCATAGSSIIGTPGVIFELSLDGFIFLIAVKLLFALLRFGIFLLTSAVCIIVAILISPFTFVPAMRRVSNGD